MTNIHISILVGCALGLSLVFTVGFLWFVFTLSNLIDKLAEIAAHISRFYIIYNNEITSYILHRIK